MCILRVLACSEETNSGVSQEALLNKIQNSFTKDEYYDAVLWLENVGLITKKNTESGSSSKNRSNHKYLIQMPLLSHWLRDSMTGNQIAKWKV
jgi:hypothetical protein